MNHSERLERAEFAYLKATGGGSPKGIEKAIAAYLGDDTAYVIDSDLNDWDALGAIDSDGESLGTLVPLDVEGSDEPQ